MQCLAVQFFKEKPEIKNISSDFSNKKLIPS